MAGDALRFLPCRQIHAQALRPGLCLFPFYFTISSTLHSTMRRDCFLSAPHLGGPMSLPSCTAYRFAVGLALTAAFLIVWLNAAAGLIGIDDDDPANLLYVGVHRKHW